MPSGVAELIRDCDADRAWFLSGSEVPLPLRWAIHGGKQPWLVNPWRSTRCPAGGLVTDPEQLRCATSFKPDAP